MVTRPQTTRGRARWRLLATGAATGSSRAGPARARPASRRRVVSAGALVAVLAFADLQPVAAQSVEPPAPLSPATVSVDFGERQGELPRPERYNNFGNLTAWPEQRADDVAFFNEQGLHGDVHRVWLSSPNAPTEANVFNQCDLATETCDFSPEVDAYLTDASTVADSVLVNLNPTDFVEGERPLADLEPLVELILRSLEEEHPGVHHVEVFNEPDWNFHGVERRAGTPVDQTTLQPDDLYRFYVPFYRAVNTVNRGRPRADRLQVGGPALMSMDPRWMEPFLDDFAADPDPHKRLDFITYHAYLSWDESYQRPNLYSGDLSVVASERATIRDWLRERHLPRIPSFVTETGIYPGPSFDDPEPRNDYIRQAAGLATYGYLYANQPGTSMFNWCVRHRVEERKDQLVTRTPDGPLTGTFTPYGNMLLMQSMMKDTRVSAESDGPILDGDNGVYAMASADRTGASVMAWNWQHVHDESYRTTIDMSRLPSHLRHGPVRQQLFRIDQSTSNHFADPATANLQLVGDDVVTAGRTLSVTIDLAPNAIYLILLEPA